MNNLENSIEDKIRYYDGKLEELAIHRAEINKLKKAKDELVKQYIGEMQAPKSLKLELLNYKALFFYFKDKFIRKPLILKLAEYKKNGHLILQQAEDKKNGYYDFTDFFSNGQIQIKSEFKNFPHLIGIKNKPHESGYLDKFMDDIFYETTLLEDYKEHNPDFHKRDIHKIKTFSWIIETLDKPRFVFNQGAIKRKRRKGKFESDLIFARQIKTDGEYNWHIVGLQKIGQKNFVIKSHFPIKENKEFSGKFYIDNKIYEGKV